MVRGFCTFNNTSSGPSAATFPEAVGCLVQGGACRVGRRDLVVAVSGPSSREIDEQSRARRWKMSVGWRKREHPGVEQIKARMLARRSARIKKT